LIGALAVIVRLVQLVPLAAEFVEDRLLAALAAERVDFVEARLVLFRAPFFDRRPIAARVVRRRPPLRRADADIVRCLVERWL
jgi:hypothetical protein